MEVWELIAREQIRNTIGKYTIAGDRFRVPMLLSTFAPDGVLEFMHGPSATGHDEIAKMLSRVVAENVDFSNRPETGFYSRHHVSSIWLEEVTTTQAKATCYYVMYSGRGVYHWGRYFDTLVPIGDDWLFKRRIVAVDSNNLHEHES